MAAADTCMMWMRSDLCMTCSCIHRTNTQRHTGLSVAVAFGAPFSLFLRLHLWENLAKWRMQWTLECNTCNNTLTPSTWIYCVTAYRPDIVRRIKYTFSHRFCVWWDRWQGNHLAAGIECKYLRPHFFFIEFERRHSHSLSPEIANCERCSVRMHNVG